MGSRYALHVGLDVIDPNAVGLPSMPTPTGGVAAAREMASLTRTRRFDEVVCLTDGQATIERVGDEFDRLAALLRPGDLFVVSLAGHARPYKSGASVVRQEFILFNYAWPDDEIFDRLTTVKSFARVLVILEACYADGLITPGPFAALLNEQISKALLPLTLRADVAISRILPRFINSPRGWRTAADSVPAGIPLRTTADILVLAACSYNLRAKAAKPGVSRLPPFTDALSQQVDKATSYVDLMRRIQDVGVKPVPVLNTKLLKSGSDFPNQPPFEA